MTKLSVYKKTLLGAQSIRRDLRKDSAQVFYLLPVFFGLGVAAYFSLSYEPELLTARTTIIVVISILFFTYALKKRMLFLALMCVAGFVLMQLRAHHLQSPVWQGGETPRSVHGTVERLEAMPKGYRVLLKQVDVWQVPPKETPKYIRLKVHEIPSGIEPGRRIALRASLRAPARPAYPGGYDFARWAYFQQIGAVGFALTVPQCLDCNSPTQLDWFEKDSALHKPLRGATRKIAVYVEKIRQTITERIQKTAQEKYVAEAGVASALLAGFQGSIPKAELNALRVSGLAHILSISGLHMAMVTMTIFYGFRRLLALFPAIALRHNTKKISAILALSAGAFYLLLAGAPVPAQRSFVMVALFFIALLLDRVGMTLRPLTWAALIVLCLTPESLMGPSFQMSFAATLVLIITFRAIADAHVFSNKKKTIFSRMGVYIASMLLSSVVAGLATLPFALYHFGRIATYSVLANMCAVPLASFIIMPAGMIGMVLIPLHLETIPFLIMLKALDLMLYIAELCAALPAASISLPQPSDTAMLLLSLGALAALLLKSALRYVGRVCFVLGVIGLFIPSAGPDLVVHEGGKLFALKNADNSYYFSSLQHARTAREEWAETLGVDSPLKLYGKNLTQENAFPWECSDKGCALETEGYHTVHLDRQSPAAQCGAADVVIQMAGTKNSCKGSVYTLGGPLLEKEGTHAFWLRRNAWGVKTVAQERGVRLWTR